MTFIEVCVFISNSEKVSQNIDDNWTYSFSGFFSTQFVFVGEKKP